MFSDITDEWEVQDIPDRRKKPRFLFHDEIKVVFTEPDGVVDANGEDISPEGLKFLSQRSFTIDSQVVIKLSDTLQLKAIVRTVSEVDSMPWELDDDAGDATEVQSQFNIGVEFVDLSEQQKQELSDYISNVLL